MKLTIHFKYRILIVAVFFSFGASLAIVAQELKGYDQFSGIVLDSNTREPLENASVTANNSNLSMTTNTEGRFSLKVTEADQNGKLIVSFLGYTSKEIPIASLSEGNNKIMLVPKITNLTEINLTAFKDAETLVRTVFKKRGDNNSNQAVIMTAFYRETIKRRNRNVSLTEAVVSVYKQPNGINKKDQIELNKARKSTDYSRLDTVAIKLQGGPFSALYVDVMKYPEYIFADDYISDYSFKFEPPTTINGKYVYVVSFNQKPEILDPLYRGTLFIDSETLALTNANYSLNIENSVDVENLFVKKKPRDINVYPELAAYQVDYSEKDGKWYYSYGNIELTFKVTQKGKLFNSVYTLASEMAVTDWENIQGDAKIDPKNRLKPTVVMSDEVSGFSDPDFWGAYNVIEPEKSIESAISKIQRQIRKNKS